MKLNIRKAVATDAESIAMINISSWQKTYKDIFPSDFLNGLSESNNQIVGFCKMGPSTKENYKNCGEIMALYVKNETIKKGIGKQLFLEANKLLKEVYEYNVVSCIKENSSNEFYKKVGCKFLEECDFNLKNTIYKENLYKCP